MQLFAAHDCKCRKVDLLTNGKLLSHVQLFRKAMLDASFQEIHSPKLIGGASEGGSAVFTLQYFGQPACLAQSPQFYKQMAIAGDMQRVFEIGPVFRCASPLLGALTACLVPGFSPSGRQPAYNASACSQALPSKPVHVSQDSILVCVRSPSSLLGGRPKPQWISNLCHH